MPYLSCAYFVPEKTDAHPGDVLAAIERAEAEHQCKCQRIDQSDSWGFFKLFVRVDESTPMPEDGTPYVITKNNDYTPPKILCVSTNLARGPEPWGLI